MNGIVPPETILTFWREAGPTRWFSRDDSFDDAVRSRFLATYEAARTDQLGGWEDDPNSALALVIVLDQFPRNMFRGEAQTYAADEMARVVADRAIAKGFDQRVETLMRPFFYLPFMHSEHGADQERCVSLYRALGDPEGLRYAEIHADIIRRFGRFPHRNRVLARPTTPEEQAFLDAGGFAG